MATEFAQVHNHMVLRDADNTWRWYDAWGDHVVKYEMNTAAVPTDNTTGMPVEFVNTLVGASTFAHTDVAGGAVLLTAEAADNDGVKLQLGDELGGAGENVSFALRYPCYFHARLQLDDVSQTDFLAGFCVTDTACLDAVTDGIYFRSIDETGVVNFVLEQNSLETVTAVATMTDATDIDLEFNYGYDGSGNVYVYVNSVLLATIADTDVYFPNDELLRLTFEFLQGEIAAHTCTLKRLKFIQIQEA
jgi:hypothetical protein